jgi:carboxylesterase type B
MAAIYGDVSYIAPCRLFSTVASFNAKQKVYRYRFNVTDPRFPSKMGSTHSCEIGFVWSDPSIKVDPMRTRVSEFMSRAWASFIVDQNPNEHGIETVPKWEPYSTTSSGRNLVIGEDGFTTENDIFRKDAMSVIIDEILKI